MSTDKITQKETFVQKDVFKELDLGEKTVSEIYKFKDELRVKTIYEKYRELYNFGNVFKYLLSLLTAFLSSIGLFFLFYFDQFTGVLSYLAIGLAVLFGVGLSYGIEYAKHNLLPIISKSWLRDKEIQKGLIIIVFALGISSMASTAYGMYKVIDLFYIPTITNIDEIGKKQEETIGDYENKIKEAKAHKSRIDTERTNYTNKTGNGNSWMHKTVYINLTSDISRYEKEISTLREEVRTNKENGRKDNKTTKAEHASGKYVFIWVGLAVSWVCEMLLLGILFGLEWYKYKSLKQLDTINSPISTILQIVENPLQGLKTHLLNGGALLASEPNQASINTADFQPQSMPLNQEISPILQTQNHIKTPSVSSSNYSGKKTSSIGFKYGSKKGVKGTQKTATQKPHNALNPQGVSTSELAKIELKILHYKRMVKESEIRAQKLTQKAAIERNKKALKNRRNQLRNWKAKKAEYGGKILG